MNATSTATKPRRRWLQFDLRRGLAAITFVGVLAAVGFRSLRDAWWETSLAQQLKSRGAGVATEDIPVNRVLRLFGPENTQSIGIVILKGRQFTDADAAELAKLHQLMTVQLEDTSVSLHAAGCIRAGFCLRPWQMNPHEVNCAYWLERDAASEWAPCQFVLDCEQSLQWLLACARYRQDPSAERAAYVECKRLVELLLVPNPTARYVADELYAAKVAWLEMQIAMLDRDPAKAIQIGQAWQARMQDTPQRIWPTQLDLESVDWVEAFLLATRLTREIDALTARLRGDRPAELQASDDAIAALTTGLRRIIGPTNKVKRTMLRDHWASSLVVVLETEKLHRAHLTGDNMTAAADADLLRRVKMAHDDLINLLQGSSYPASIDTRYRMLGLADRLVADVATRRRDVANAGQIEREYTDLLHVLARDDAYNGHISQTMRATYLIQYLLRWQEQTGQSACALKQYELQELLYAPVTRPWTTLPKRPTVIQWRAEYLPEWRHPDDLRRR